MVGQLTMRLPLALNSHYPDLRALFPLAQGVALHVGGDYLIVLGGGGDAWVGASWNVRHSLRHVLVGVALTRNQLSGMVEGPLIAVPPTKLLERGRVPLAALQLDLLLLVRHHG